MESIEKCLSYRINSKKVYDAHFLNQKFFEFLCT